MRIEIPDEVEQGIIFLAENRDVSRDKLALSLLKKQVVYELCAYLQSSARNEKVEELLEVLVF